MEAPPKRLLVFCDGTWCGRETGTYTNIRAVADMVGKMRFSDDSDKEPTKVHVIEPRQANVIAGYQEGIGVNKTFLEYLWDGATASTIGDECTSVYKYIVDHYTTEHEIYIFGFSRGSYTARCVAGMINNCGIIKKQPGMSDSDISTLCNEVYRTYRSPLEIDRPNSVRSLKFRSDANRVWPVKRPIRVMVLGDTVGSLGIPRLNAGVGFDWPEFYDQNVSTVVQELYHAPALHDRLWVFQPCLAFNGPSEEEVKIHQTWFPGCHYDLGRQAFRFIRQAPTNQLEKVLGAIPDALSKTIYPNTILSDLLLRWMLQSVQTVEATDLRSESIIPDITAHIQAINSRLASPSARQPGVGPTGSGDIYGDILECAPAGTLFAPLMKFGSSTVHLLNKVFPKLGDNIQDLLGVKTVLRILGATRDRRIPGNAADIYPYKQAESVRVRGEMRTFVVQQQADMQGRNGRGRLRYPSQMCESFELWGRVFGG
ncbi:hypothetical protein K491DRAFT_606642 [Lophiostoma macrostomum CBS 122681]|uniref:T6SS Phospholipase effector Tle1-like catalytic domain-containing protein n=1 Tax=Lophiostoma macrostomum CBS 122681 TaxID=1314788 RepID=A0A6A6SVC6_9PLEO|nr:hypothetical protein K491DRAFT_606642 [Lophiostoma macrostomum CBS 122681]